jgi:hypothetical protein
MTDDICRIDTPDLRVSVLKDEEIGAADYVDAGGHSRSSWKPWVAWEEFAIQILEKRFPGIRALLKQGAAA